MLYVSWEFLRKNSLEDLFRPLAAEGSNHSAIITNLFITVKPEIRGCALVLPSRPLWQIDLQTPKGRVSILALSLNPQGINNSDNILEPIKMISFVPEKKT
jgi:hypothetical protein